MIDFADYIKALKTHKPEEITEHSLRPDFKLTLHNGILGYVENKALGADLSKVLKSDQIGRNDV